MSRHQVYTESKAGGDRCYLGTLAKVSALQWTWAWPGGPQSCQFTFNEGARYSHRALTLGRTVTVLGGASKMWTGILSKPGRGNPWQAQCDGIAALGNNYLAIPGASGNPLNLNEVIDAAVARGLPWTSRPNLPTTLADSSSIGVNMSDVATVNADLSKVLPESGLTWNVDTAGALTDLAPPTGAPTYLFLTTDPAGGRTLDGYVTAYLVVYTAANGVTATVWARNAAAELLFPPVEQVLDLTDRGTLTPTQATTIGQARLGLAGPRAPWADSLVFARGMIRNAWGSIVDPATVRPPCLARMLLMDPDHEAETSYAAATDFWLGQTTYDDDADTLTVAPLDLSSDDFASV